MPPDQTLALCICTRNRPDDLRRCLRSIERAHRLPHQVLVSDDSDASCLVEHVAREFPFVTYQRGPQAGLGANRNACLARQHADLVMFVDDDVQIPATLFDLLDGSLSTAPATILSGFEYKHIGEETFRIEPGNADFWGYQRLPSVNACRAIVINATIFPSELFRQIQFDPLLRYGSEEMDLTHHALALGYTIRFDPRLYVDHYPSDINRKEYAHLVEASRMYVMAKTYLLYEKSALKALTFCLLAPLKLLVGLARRQGWEGVRSALAASRRAFGYLTGTLGTGGGLRRPARDL